MEKLKAQWMRIPKWLRFILYYGTAPVWFPTAFIVLLAAWCVIAPIVRIIMAWENFK